LSRRLPGGGGGAVDPRTAATAPADFPDSGTPGDLARRPPSRLPGPGGGAVLFHDDWQPGTDMGGKTYHFIDPATGKQAELKSRSGTLGPDVVDIRALYAEHGLFTYDPGFGSTASCESKITFIDGDQGVLLYRGYPVEQLAEKSSFMEVCYLLLHGDLPSAAEL
jgi:hypothetical protein